MPKWGELQYFFLLFLSLRFTSPRFNPLEHVSVINIEDLDEKNENEKDYLWRGSVSKWSTSASCRLIMHAFVF